MFSSYLDLRASHSDPHAVSSRQPTVEHSCQERAALEIVRVADDDPGKPLA